MTSSTLLRMTHSVTSIDANFFTPRCIRHGWLLLLKLRRRLLLLRFRLQVLLQVSLQLAERQLFGGFERIRVWGVVFRIRSAVVAVVVVIVVAVVVVVGVILQRSVGPHGGVKDAGGIILSGGDDDDGGGGDSTAHPKSDEKS